MPDRVYTKSELSAMVKPLLLKYDMASASLFGSYARGNATPSSDIDIILKGNEGFRPLNIFGFTEDLHRVSGKRVDVYEISELNLGPFRDAVIKDLVAL